MSLVLYYHPLSSFCWKVLIPLYENDTAFEPRMLQNLQDPAEAAAFRALWPVGKMPILVEEAHDRIIPETSIIIEWLDHHHRGAVRFVPEDTELALEARLWDRIYDLYVQQPMQRIVFDRIRPPEQKNPTMVAEERELLKRTMAMVDAHVADKHWATGEQFTLADCAAAPALFYADKVEPFEGRWPNAAALLERLKARPSVARVLREAEPYLQYFPSGMTAFAQKVADLTGVTEGRLERLAGGDLSEVLLVPRAGEPLVAKGGPNVSAEAAMLRALAGVGTKVPAVEAEYDTILLIDHVPNDGVMSPNAWWEIGDAAARLHRERGEAYGWPVDYALGTVALDNREGRDWLRFWGEQRLIAAASLLDRPWRARVEALVQRLGDLLPNDPPPAFLHGDLWAGNILVDGGRLAAFIDPACYYGHAEVDLAMLCLFSTPPGEFWTAYGGRPDDWEERLPVYQLFPALVHFRLFGATYAPMVDRLLGAMGA